MKKITILMFLLVSSFTIIAQDFSNQWVGQYTGNGDHYNAENGKTLKNRQVKLSIKKSLDKSNSLQMAVTIYTSFKNQTYGYSTLGGWIPVYSSQEVKGEVRQGNLIHSFELRKQGNNIIGTFKGYNINDKGYKSLTNSISFNVTK